MNGRLASMSNCQHPLICFRTASVFGMAWPRLQITCKHQHLEALFIPQTAFSLRMLIWVVALTLILSVTRTTVTTNLTHKYTYIYSLTLINDYLRFVTLVIILLIFTVLTD
jgi:phosphoglycerol transferase MdoB-like AlkP superfamily enzyme